MAPVADLPGIRATFACSAGFSYVRPFLFSRCLSDGLASAGAIAHDLEGRPLT